MITKDYVDSMILLQARDDVVRVIKNHSQIAKLQTILEANNVVIGVLEDETHDNKSVFYRLKYEIDTEKREKVWDEPEYLCNLDDYYQSGKVKSGNNVVLVYYAEKQPLKNNLHKIITFSNKANNFNTGYLDEYLYQQTIKEQ